MRLFLRVVQTARDPAFMPWIACKLSNDDDTQNGDGCHKVIALKRVRLAVELAGADRSNRQVHASGTLAATEIRRPLWPVCSC